MSVLHPRLLSTQSTPGSSVSRLHCLCSLDEALNPFSQIQAVIIEKIHFCLFLSRLLFKIFIGSKKKKKLKEMFYSFVVKH